MTGLRDEGFAVLQGPLAPGEVSKLGRAYDAVLASLPEAKIRRGSTSVRFGGLVALAPFVRLYLHPPLLEAARDYIGGPIKLSSFHARTLLPRVAAPPLHQDIEPGADGDPLVGFIVMVDAFTPDNGATRFAPRSRSLSRPPPGSLEQQVCGQAGSLLIFDGATWHEHGANLTDAPRRSVQGYFVRREHTAAVRWADDLPEDQAASLPDAARDLLCL